MNILGLIDNYNYHRRCISCESILSNISDASVYFTDV